MLLPGEPDLGPWRPVSDADLAALLPDSAAAPGQPDAAGRRLVLVDGIGGSGKSTVASRLAALWPDAAVVHTDDIAWWLDPFDWAAELVTGVLEPWASGAAVDYRPPGWVARGRPGSVRVPADAAVLIVEGSGSGRREFAERANLLVWVQVDRGVGRARCLDRAEAAGESRAEEAAFFDAWEPAETAHFRAERTWERADVVLTTDASAAAPAGVPRVDRSLAGDPSRSSGLWISTRAGAA